MAVWETIIGRNVEREGFDLAQVLVEKWLKHLFLVRQVLQPQKSGIPFILELGEAAIAVKMHCPEVVDIVDRCVLGIFLVPVVDHTKDHSTSEDPTGVGLGSRSIHHFATEVAGDDSLQSAGEANVKISKATGVTKVIEVEHAVADLEDPGEARVARTRLSCDVSLDLISPG
jgi:hypothetical protein